MDKQSYLLVIAGIIAVIVELLMGAATGFDLLIIGILCIISGIFGIAFNSFYLALGLIIILSLLYVFFGRKFIKKSLSIATKKTNIDGILGKKGIVVKHIKSSRPGQVKVEGEVWLAQSDHEIDVNKEVTIESVTGITLKVTPLRETRI